MRKLSNALKSNKKRVYAKVISHSQSDESRFYIKIDRRECSHITRPRNSDDEWDADDLEYTHEIDGFKIVSESEGWDFILNELPEEAWYLVCAFYSSGNSFHHVENCLALVSFVKNKEDAKVIVNAIKRDYKKYQDNDEWEHKPLVVHLPVANKDESIPTGTWKGYFERLTSIEARPIGETIKVEF